MGQRRIAELGTKAAADETDQNQTKAPSKRIDFSDLAQRFADSRYSLKRWTTAEMRLKLLRRLRAMGLGVAQVENQVRREVNTNALSEKFKY